MKSAAVPLLALCLLAGCAKREESCQQMGWPTYVQEIIIGAIIVLAVAADRYRASRAAAVA